MAKRPREITTSPYFSSNRKAETRASSAKTNKTGNGGDDVAANVLPDVEDLPPPPPSLAARKRKRIGESTTAPAVNAPPDWERLYALVKEMRNENPTAPVDTMGCAELYWRSSSRRDQRFHNLVALMLSSQTKDTVTAAAMQRLHTELGPTGTVNSEEDQPCYDQVTKEEEATSQPRPSSLTLENMLAVSQDHLNSLIAAVGFHNNKAKYLKQTALVLRDSYNSDIPRTAAELMTLPGVGPKMAHLCMTAAWGVTEGIGVDVHVHRITNLWGWHDTRTPEETRQALEAWLPREKWAEINKLLVGLGQTVCLPGSNSRRRCQDCALAGTGLCKGENVAKEEEGERRR